MKKEEFCCCLAAVTPEMPERFSGHVDRVLAQIMTQKKEKTVKSRQRCGRYALVWALMIVILCSSAFAGVRWGVFDALRVLLGAQQSDANSPMQQILHTEIVNGVKITVYEAGYDGRTLFVQYSYCLPEGEKWDGTAVQAMEKLMAHNVGWWTDCIWINGRCVEMAPGSGDEGSSTETPGEIMMTAYWRLDQIGAALDGETHIALPIGERESGTVGFTFDAGKMQQKVTTLLPDKDLSTITPAVTVRVKEAAFTPLLTYITLELEGNPEALAAYRAERGEGFYDEAGRLQYRYSSLDVHEDYICGLQLVDGSGELVFPDEGMGCSGVGDDWAEFLYPGMENIPDALWLAPVRGERADLQSAIRVK